MGIGAAQIGRIADELMAALDAAAQIELLSGRVVGFDMADAYRVSAEVAERRAVRGERQVGWKIGFTNRTIWDEYGVYAPIWGPIYSSTLAFADRDGRASCAADHFCEPRIEPEIVFRMAAAPRAGMTEAELLGCIGAVGHGVEVVQSLFPAWRFRAEDTVAAFALHGCYRCGALTPRADRDDADWLKALAGFEVVLSRDGAAVDSGGAANVLGGPLSALRVFVDSLARQPAGRAVMPGDLVTTGTVTRAFPIRPGETWTTEIIGLSLPGLAVSIE